MPAGALPAGTTVCIYKGNLAALASQVPAGQTPTSAYAVVWNNPFGGAPPDALSNLTLTVTDPSVHAGDPVYVFNKSRGQVTNAGTASEGSWVVSFTQDPSYVVTTVTPAAAPGAAVPVVAQPRTTG